MYDLATDGSNWFSFRDLRRVHRRREERGALQPRGTSKPFPLGTGTTRYVPSAGNQPVVAADVTAVTDRATATSYLFFAKSPVPTGTKVMYAGLAAYLRDATGTRASDVKAQTRYGQLKISTNGGSTFPTTVTTYAPSTLLTWPTGAPFGNGRTSALTRNTWFQWCFQGDAYVTHDCSTTKKVTVNPTMSVGVQTLSGKKRVYGKVARTGGTAVMWRYASGKWVPFTKVAVASNGRFSFPYRTLAKGSYKVTTSADTYWGAGLKQFSI